jgi:peptide/nickel transport system substrate-binding protein
MRQRLTTLRRLACGVAAVGMMALGAATISAPTSGASVTKTVVTWALAPGTAPNYIFPMVTFAKCSTSNIGEFQNMLYRNLYSFGAGGGTNTSVGLNKKLSTAYTPTYSTGGTTVTIKLKTYKWSNGEKLTSTDVLFYFNMLRVAKTHYCYWFNYTGLAMPTIIKSVTASKPTTVVLTLSKKVSAHWFTYNELSQITPMPMAWDVTTLHGAPNSGGCAKAAYGTGDAKCKAVYDFLSLQAGFNPTKPTAKITALSTYATSPIWKIVNGPWKLKSFGPTAPVVMVPNPTYSGSNKPKIKEFIEKPFSTTAAEFNDLVAGTVSVGYLPEADITSNAKLAKTVETEPKQGANNPRLTSTYTLKKGWLEQITYFPLNFNSNGDTGQAGAIFKQAYFRQALEEGINQPQYIKSLFHGYGVPDYGPVPPTPKNPYLDSTERHNPFAYNPSKGKALLKAHGWKVSSGGTDVCQRAGTGSSDCGAGIKKGAKLSFTFSVATTPPIPDMAAAEKATWASEGIQVRLNKATFDTIIGVAVPCKATSKSCSWEMANWGGGWVFAPDYYPTGEELFLPGAGANSGNFTTSTSNKLIKATDVKTVSLSNYENYLTKAVPVVWEPVSGAALAEIHKGLKGFYENAFSDFTAATFRWTS